MVVNFYKNTSPEIAVKKTLTLVKNDYANFKAPVSLTTPVLVMSMVDLTNCNYMYIEQFKRYYFIDEVVTQNEGVTEIYGRIDVLMSFDVEILASTGIIERNENLFNKYITDSQYTVVNYERIQTKEFPSGFPSDGEYVLVVAGN